MLELQRRLDEVLDRLAEGTLSREEAGVRLETVLLDAWLDGYDVSPIRLDELRLTA